jgi:hypothetical protein
VPLHGQTAATAEVDSAHCLDRQRPADVCAQVLPPSLHHVPHDGLWQQPSVVCCRLAGVWAHKEQCGQLVHLYATRPKQRQTQPVMILLRPPCLQLLAPEYVSSTFGGPSVHMSLLLHPHGKVNSHVAQAIHRNVHALALKHFMIVTQTVLCKRISSAWPWYCLFSAVWPTCYKHMHACVMFS